MSEFEKAISLNPQLIQPLAHIMGILIEQGGADKAIERANRQLTTSKNNPLIYNLIGKAYLVKKDEKKAEEYFNKSIEMDKNTLASYMDLGALYARSKTYDKAIARFEEAIKVNPNYLQPYMLIGILYDSQKNHDKAKEYYEKALKIDPGFAPAANNLAWIYAEHGGNIDIALDLAQRAKEKLPEDPGVSDTLGWIYYKKGAYLKAISLLKDSSEKLENNPTVRYHLGMAYYKNGNKELARRELDAALNINQKFDEIEEAKKVIASLRR
jgi:tetratricopeptide (TPR) repeat protein